MGLASRVFRELATGVGMADTQEGRAVAVLSWLARASGLAFAWASTEEGIAVAIAERSFWKSGFAARVVAKLDTSVLTRDSWKRC